MGLFSGRSPKPADVEWDPAEKTIWVHDGGISFRFDLATTVDMFGKSFMDQVMKNPNRRFHYKP